MGTPNFDNPGNSPVDNPVNQSPKPGKTKWLVIGVIGLLILGAAAYFLAGSKFFQGKIELKEDDDAEIAKLESYVNVNKGEKFGTWPLEANKESSFTVLKEAENDLLFWTDKDAGNFKMLHADFEFGEFEGKNIIINNFSNAENTEIISWCFYFNSLAIAKNEPVEKCFDKPQKEYNIDFSGYKAGPYNVSLVIRDNDGRTDYTDKDIVISEPEPTLDMLADCEATVNGVTAKFTDKSQLINLMDNSPAEFKSDEWRWEWNFGDGETSTERNPTHIYPVNEGSSNKGYYITLNVTNLKNSELTNEGECTVTILHSDKLSEPSLQANIEFKKTKNLTTGIEYQLLNKSDVKNDEIKNVIWEFGNDEKTEIPKNQQFQDLDGDGIKGDVTYFYSYLTGPNAPESKDYTVKLTVNNGGELSSTTTKTLTIATPIKADFSCEMVEKTETGYDLIFTDQSTTTDEVNFPVEEVELTSIPGHKLATGNIAKDVLKDKTYSVDYDTIDKGISYSAKSKVTQAIDHYSTTLIEKCPVAEPEIELPEEIDETLDFTDKNPIPDLNELSKVKKADIGGLKPIDLNKTILNSVLSASTLGNTDNGITEFNYLIAPAGSTVYFKAACKDGENLVKISPLTIDLEQSDNTDTTIKEFIAYAGVKTPAMLDIDLSESSECKKEPVIDEPLTGIPIEAKCSVTPLEGDTNTIFTFNGNESTGSIFEGKWDFGDDTLSPFDPDDNNTKTIGHTYIETGDYTTTLTLWNKGEDSKNCKVKVKVKPIDKSACSDGVDNDLDGFSDFNSDPGCESADDDDENDKTAGLEDKPLCSDEKDNDQDGETDFPDDPGCDDEEDNSEEDPVETDSVCLDGLDNDNDGFIDFGDDPGCSSENDGDEANAADPDAPACSNNIDDDEDGYIDFGVDAGCETPEDEDESNPIPKNDTACSDGLDNDNDGAIDIVDQGCENATDNSEENKEEVVTSTTAELPVCLEATGSPKNFGDIEAVVNQFVIEQESGTVYDGEDEDYKGKAIFEGYLENGKRYFRPFAPIRRDEAIKTILFTTCYLDYLEAQSKLDKDNIYFKDPEFDDPDYWAADLIYTAVNSGLVEEKHRFYPNDEVTRAEYLKFLIEIYAELSNTKVPKCNEDTDVPFIDVNKDDWFCGHALMAKKLEISKGFKDANGHIRLNPDKNLTRADAAIMLWNYYVATTGKGFSEDEDIITNDEQ